MFNNLRVCKGKNWRTKSHSTYSVQIKITGWVATIFAVFFVLAVYVPAVPVAQNLTFHTLCQKLALFIIFNSPYLLTKFEVNNSKWMRNLFQCTVIVNPSYILSPAFLFPFQHYLYLHSALQYISPYFLVATEDKDLGGILVRLQNRAEDRENMFEPLTMIQT